MRALAAPGVQNLLLSEDGQLRLIDNEDGLGLWWLHAGTDSLMVPRSQVWLHAGTDSLMVLRSQVWLHAGTDSLMVPRSQVRVHEPLSERVHAQMHESDLRMHVPRPNVCARTCQLRACVRKKPLAKCVCACTS